MTLMFETENVELVKDNFYKKKCIIEKWSRYQEFQVQKGKHNLTEQQTQQQRPNRTPK